WAVVHGQTGWLAWADAVVIEGIAIVAGFEIHRDHHRPNGPRRRITFPMLVLVAGFGVQMAAQVALAEPTVAGWLLAAMPALGFLVVVKLLMRRAPAPAETASQPGASEHPEPAASTPTESTAAPVESSPAGSTSSSSGLRLSPTMTDRVTTVLDEVRAEGREPTTDDVRRAVKVPEALAAQILAELPARNGHPVSTP